VVDPEHRQTLGNGEHGASIKWKPFLTSEGQQLRARQQPRRVRERVDDGDLRRR
jgi:hypothetical protein